MYTPSCGEELNYWIPQVTDDLLFFAYRGLLTSLINKYITRFDNNCSFQLVYNKIFMDDRLLWLTLRGTKFWCIKKKAEISLL